MLDRAVAALIPPASPAAPADPPMTRDQAVAELETTRARAAQLEAIVARAPTPSELARMTPEAVADLLERRGGREAIAASLAGTRPPGPLTQAEIDGILAGRITDPELVAAHFGELERAVTAQKEASK